MIRRILKIVLALCLAIVFSYCCIMNVLAEGDNGGMAGGSGGTSQPVYSGGGGGSGTYVDPCTGIDINKYNYDGPSTIMNAKCTGYSWMFFRAFGPSNASSLSNEQKKVYVLPKPIYCSGPKCATDGSNAGRCCPAQGDNYGVESVTDPVISGSCMNPQYDNGGFWHFGQNSFTERDSARIYYSRVGGQMVDLKNGVGGESLGGSLYGYLFNVGVGIKTDKNNAAMYNFGHFSTRNYSSSFNQIYKGDQYTAMFNAGKLSQGNAKVFKTSLDLLNQGWGNGGVYKRVYNNNDRGQRLYKKINNVWVLMYIAVGTKSNSEVFEKFKTAYKVANKVDYTGTDFPAWYYFCSWNVKSWDLNLIPVREGTYENLSNSVSWSGAKWHDVAYENTKATVTRGTNTQWYFVGFQLKLPTGEYIDFSNTSTSYASGGTITIEHIGADQTIYAVYRPISLTAKAVDELGNPLDGRNGRNKIDDVTATGFTAGGAASVTRRTDNRYIFKGFKLADSAADTVNREFITTTNSGASYYVTGTPTEESARETFHVKNLTGAVTVYAVYEEKSSFLGQIQLLEGTTQKAAVGYSDKDGSTTYNIANCNPVNGCKVTFKHNFQRKTGDKTVTYTITRDSNYYIQGQNRGVESKTLVPNTNNNGIENFSGVANGNTKQVYSDGELTLVPGQVVCEILSFKPYVWKDDSVTLKLCASALGNAQPDDPADPGNPENTGAPWNDPDGDNDNYNGASAFLKLEVKNETVSRYSTYRKIVYAKPNDKVKYRVTYNPILQYTAFLKPQQMRIDGGKIVLNTDDRSLQDLFKDNKGSLNDWNNAFYVYSVENIISNSIFNNNDDCNNGECKYDVGVFTKQSEESKSVSVQPGNVGQELKETAVTNQTNNVKTTPSQVMFVSNGNAKYNLGNVITNQRASEALVRVPYNFNIGVCMKKAQNDTDCAESDLGVFDAGTGKNLYFEVDVNKKANSETAGGSSYATIVPKATTKIILYKGGVDNGGLVDGDICAKKYGLNADGINCNYSEVKEWQGANALNADGILEGVSKTIPATFDVPDAEAGTSYCVAAAVYPASSADVNAANYATNSTGWKDVEGNHLWQVSKSVCFIVGKKPTFQVWGGSFYGGGNVTVSSTSKNNLTLPSGNITISDGTLVFSSWVEQTVVAEGKVDRLASGAATGLVFNNDKNKAEGGSLENPESFCKYRVPLSIANYGSGLCQENSGNLTGNSNIIVNTNKKIFTEIATEGVERISVDGDYSTPNYPMIVSKGTTRIIEATGKVIINGNIIYDENESYNNTEEIPKMVIYAKGDIEINCNVTRIDAILLADGTIYSCGTYIGKGTVTDYNEVRTRTNQLIVNGAILTKGLELGRTYGMGTGTYSKIPAEIVNYDSSIILWAKGKTDTDDFGKMYQVYINELAPRY